MKILENGSYWAEDLARELGQAYTSLTQSQDADLLIVGGGFAGLSAALHYKSEHPTRDIILLDAHWPGFGASGRNAGFVESHLMAMSWLLEGSLPEVEQAWAMNALLRRFDRTLEYIKTLNIEAELRPCKGVLNAPSYLAEDILRNLQEGMREYGLHASWKTAAEALAEYGCTGHGALVTDSYSVHPLRFALGLAQAAQQAGVRIYGGTAVQTLQAQGDGIEAWTTGGYSVRANRCVIAANAWAKRLGLATTEIDAGKAASCTMIASAPLAPEVLEQAGTDTGAMVAELTMGLSYRRIHKGRVLYGGFDDSSVEAISAPSLKNSEKLVKSAKKEMPWLADTEFEYVWSGPIFTPGNDLPAIVPVPHLPRTAVITGNGSSGVPWALVAGGLVGGLISEGYEGDAEGERLRRAMLDTRVSLMALAGIGVRAVWHSIKETVRSL
ncbi:MAG: NAD(P)/FAD-dependent oxidoreductase [Sphingobacteriia bacterium]